MRTSFAPPTHGHSDQDRLDGTAISLAQVLSVVDAVGDQFRHAAPSKASATLVQSALWLVAAKLEALQATTRPSARPPANHESSAARTHVPAPPVSETMVATSAPAGDARDGADATSSDTHSGCHTASTRAPSPASQGITPGVPRAHTSLPKPTAELETPASVPVNAHADTVAPVSGTTCMGIADHARPTTSTTVDRSAPAVAEKTSAPPDEYDGLCAVGSRLFAAAAVTA